MRSHPKAHRNHWRWYPAPLHVPDRRACVRRPCELHLIRTMVGKEGSSNQRANRNRPPFEFKGIEGVKADMDRRQEAEVTNFFNIACKRNHYSFECIFYRSSRSPERKIGWRA